MHHLQSHWNICKENWCKLKEMYCGIQTNQYLCQLRGIWPSKSPPSYSHMYMTYKKSLNCENYKLLLFLEPQKKTLCVCHLSIFSSLLLSCMPVSTPMVIIHTLISDNKRNSIICDPWLGHCSLGILKKYLCDKSKGHWRDIYSFSHSFINLVRLSASQPVNKFVRHVL